MRMEMKVVGFEGLERAIGVMASAFEPEDVKRIHEGIVRPTPLPGASDPIMRQGFTLEEQAVEAFATEGKTRLLGGWEGYASEPRYEVYKEERGGGNKVGTWDGSATPLSATFLRGNFDHIEDIGAQGFKWGSARYYAGSFHDGQFQPWDEVTAPARPIVVINETMAREVARAYQRYIVYKLRAQGSDIRSVRVSL